MVERESQREGKNKKILRIRRKVEIKK